MSKEQFQHHESKQVWKHLETASARSHHNTRQVFEDFLEVTVCTLAGGTMEEDYLKAIRRYTEGEKGRRSIDALPEAFGALIDGMEKTREDILGDLFQGGITLGEHGQFFTPEHICSLMAQMTISPETKGQRIGDTCCGSGRTLLAAAEVSRDNEFIGQDIDIRCVRMTAINLALRNLYGWVIWGNSLENERRLILRTGFNGKGVIRKVEPKECPQPIQEIIERPPEPQAPAKQLVLF